MIIARYAIGNDIHYGQKISPNQWRRLSGVPFEAVVTTEQVDDNDQVRLLCPVERPRIFGVGFNYAAHAKETGHPLPTRAATFMKPDSAAIGPGEPIVYPAEGQRVDFECELAVIIGKGGRRIAREDVDAHIFGFTCANDVSERPIQFAEMEAGCLLIGKGFDSFCPLGPVIATGLNHRNLAIATRLNGAVKQSSNTADLVFDVAYLVSYISQAITLRPGDVIITGTPQGIGPMVPGDVVEVEIEGIGILQNPVVAEADWLAR
jgi:2-keto-4-pentenoate hydratase/2-oxohepta-3-ene-1,7-dioic acid hydratase in catechol pathway